MKKIILALSVSILLSLSFSVVSLAGAWQEDMNGWWYLNDDGSWPSRAWKYINGKWYYFGDDGYMTVDSWIKDYYVGSDGAMLVNTRTPDGFRIGADGKRIRN